MLNLALVSSHDGKTVNANVAEGDYVSIGGILKAFIVRFSDGTSELFVLTDIANVKLKPALIDRAFSHVIPTASIGVAAGQRWGVRGAGLGAALAALAQELWQYYGQQRSGRSSLYYCNSKGVIMFQGPVQVR